MKLKPVKRKSRYRLNEQGQKNRFNPSGRLNRHVQGWAAILKILIIKTTPKFWDSPCNFLHSPAVREHGDRTFQINIFPIHNRLKSVPISRQLGDTIKNIKGMEGTTVKRKPRVPLFLNQFGVFPIPSEANSMGILRKRRKATSSAGMAAK